VAKWLKGDLRELVRDTLAPERLQRQGLFNPGYARQLIAEHERGVADHRKLLWTLLMFELWPGMR
jgi:asparagine synthase (glutamine-hydrolysing)